MPTFRAWRADESERRDERESAIRSWLRPVDERETTAPRAYRDARLASGRGTLGDLVWSRTDATMGAIRAAMEERILWGSGRRTDADPSRMNRAQRRALLKGGTNG